MRGQQIAQVEGSVIKGEKGTYRVHSQTRDFTYTVTPLENGWYCSCPDFIQREVLACKHIFAVQFSRKIRETVKIEREKREVIIEQFNATTCLTCGSPNLKKSGVRRNLSGAIQRFNVLLVLRPSRSISDSRR
ncbi:hypothetical protein AUI06_10655 [archaeon 13_2_20CM_2_52_21]|nr:MAG: hypothetical protein AUI06_10655 [archaeon 13_2_20CM_2_52_21]